MRKLILIWFGAFLAICAFWLGVFWISQLASFNLQSTPEYGFSSGIGPMILTAAGMGTIITSMWHAMNCHEEGCFNIGRHKVNGTPWCNIHHEAARHEKTTEQLLTDQNELLGKVIELLDRRAA